MNLKTIIIYQNKTLFNILKELYSDRFFIDFKDKENFDDLNLKKNDNYLIITSDNKLSVENELHIKEFPIKIKKIFDLINISFLKNSYKVKSKIKIGSYTLNLNSKELSSKEKKLFLTERESNLILFLEQAAVPVKINKLQKEVWGHTSELETHTVETHIYRLRKKIKDVFNDDLFIKSSKKGYTI